MRHPHGAAGEPNRGKFVWSGSAQRTAVPRDSGRRCRGAAPSPFRPTNHRRSTWRSAVTLQRESSIDDWTCLLSPSHVYVQQQQVHHGPTEAMWPRVEGSPFLQGRQRARGRFGNVDVAAARSRVLAGSSGRPCRADPQKHRTHGEGLQGGHAKDQQPHGGTLSFIRSWNASALGTKRIGRRKRLEWAHSVDPVLRAASSSRRRKRV